jgi:hypothetical protein
MRHDFGLTLLVLILEPILAWLRTIVQLHNSLMLTLLNMNQF